MLECQIALAETYTEYLKNPKPYGRYPDTGPDDPPPPLFDIELPFRILGDADLSVTVADPRTGGRTTITGQLDWVFGTEGYNVTGYFACIKVVQAADFSSAETTLLAELGK